MCPTYVFGITCFIVWGHPNPPSFLVSPTDEGPSFLTENQIKHVVRRNSQNYESSESSNSMSSQDNSDDGDYDERNYSEKEKHELYTVALVVIKKLLDGKIIEPHHAGALKELLFINDPRVMRPVVSYMDTEDISVLFTAFRTVGLDVSSMV
jgi:hypothetical protein